MLYANSANGLTLENSLVLKRLFFIRATTLRQAQRPRFDKLSDHKGAPPTGVSLSKKFPQGACWGNSTLWKSAFENENNSLALLYYFQLSIF
jgi:hypothetical protein